MDDMRYVVVLRLCCGHRLLIADLDMAPHEALCRGWLCDACGMPSEAVTLIGALPMDAVGAMSEEERWQHLLGVTEGTTAA